MLNLPRKKRKDVTLSDEVYKWIEQQIEEARFASFSHAVEFAVRQLMKRES